MPKGNYSLINIQLMNISTYMMTIWPSERGNTWTSEKYVLATLNSTRFLKMYCHRFSPVSYRYITAGTDSTSVQWLGYRLLNHAIISWFLAVRRDLSLLQRIQTSSMVHVTSYVVKTGVSFTGVKRLGHTPQVFPHMNLKNAQTKMKT